MIRWQDFFGKVCDTLGALTYSIRLRSAGGDQGVNHAAENFYCGLLNIMLSKPEKEYHLHNMNPIQSDFPAIDLGDEENSLAVQVTTTEHRDKVNHTLSKFFENNLDQTYRRLIILVIGKKDEFKKEFRVPQSFDFLHSRDVWDLDRLGKELGKLNQKKLEELDAYLTDALSRVPRSERALRLKFPAVLERDAFVGREAELEMLKAKINDGSNAPIILYGLGGMGKTTLVGRFCADYTGGNVYYVRFQESFTQTVAVGVASGIQGYTERKPDAERDYTEAMERLKNCEKGDILVIDNADAGDDMFFVLQEDSAYEQLLELDLRLIITTRCAVDRAIEVGAMKKERLRKIFDNHRLHLQNREKDNLIEAVQGHTMTVDLIARTLKWNRRLTAARLLEVLHDGTLAEQEFNPIGTDRNGDLKQQQIYKHLRQLFNVTDIPKPRAALLRCAVLLPEDGMDLGIFDAALPKEIGNILDHQINLGWLGFDEDRRFVTIHPVIRLVCRVELTPSDQDCEVFLNQLSRMYVPEKYNISQIIQLACCLSMASDLLPDLEGSWAYEASRLWGEIGQANKSLQYALAAVQRRKALGKKISGSKMASAYNMAANAFNHLGNYESARKYGEQALKLRLRCLRPGDSRIAASYNNLGMTYSHLGKYDLALKYLWNAVYLREAQKPRKEVAIANTYNNIGTVHYASGNYEQALVFREKALKMRQKIYADNPYDPDLITSINNVGRTLHKLKRYQDALLMEQEALSRRKKTLHETDSDLANSYYNVGSTLAALNRFGEAVAHLENALQTWERGNAQDNIYFASTLEELTRYREQMALQGV